jgi:hypothetical protein
MHYKYTHVKYMNPSRINSNISNKQILILTYSSPVCAQIIHNLYNVPVLQLVTD